MVGLSRRGRVPRLSVPQKRSTGVEPNRDGRHTDTVGPAFYPASIRSPAKSRPIDVGPFLGEATGGNVRMTERSGRSGEGRPMLRPQDTDTRERKSLNGLWQFALDP